MLAPTVSAPAFGSLRPRALLGVILAAWLSVVGVLAATGFFITPAGEPPLALLGAVVLPILVFGLAYASSTTIRESVRAGDPALLTNLQGWRILGGTFLVLLSFGLLPASFALSAGWGDVAIGISAPLIARLALQQGREGRIFVIWQWLGILDLVLAVGIGASLRAVSAGADAQKMLVMSELPLAVVPAFAVPLFVILHLASLAQHRARAQAAPV